MSSFSLGFWQFIDPNKCFGPQTTRYVLVLLMLLTWSTGQPYNIQQQTATPKKLILHEGMNWIYSSPCC
jgi:hypothetical protein